MTRRARPDLPPWCGHCSEQGRLIDMGPGMAGRCPACHPARQPGGSHYKPPTPPVLRQDRMALALPEADR